MLYDSENTTIMKWMVIARVIKNNVNSCYFYYVILCRTGYKEVLLAIHHKKDIIKKESLMVQKWAQWASRTFHQSWPIWTSDKEKQLPTYDTQKFFTHKVEKLALWEYGCEEKCSKRKAMVELLKISSFPK